MTGFIHKTCTERNINIQKTRLHSLICSMYPTWSARNYSFNQPSWRHCRQFATTSVLLVADLRWAATIRWLMSLQDQLRSVSPPSAGRGRKESQVSERTFLQVHLRQCLQQLPKAWRQKLRSWLTTEAPPSDKKQCLNGRRCGCGLLPELWCLGCRRDAWRAWLLATPFPSEKFKMRLKHQLLHRSMVLKTHTHTKEDSHHSLNKKT